MRNLFLLLTLLFGLESQGQNIATKKIFQYPNLPVPPGTYLFLIDNGAGTYFNINLTQLQALFGTNASIIVISNTTLITTNITVEQPGGLTNLNLTPNSIMKSDAGDAETSVVNAAGALTNNGSGTFGWYPLYVPSSNGNMTNTTNWGVSSFQEIDAQNFFPTNLFTGKTNAPLLSTDGDGLIQNGSPLAATNVTFIPGANVTFTTNGAGAITITVSGTISGSFAASNVFSGGFLAVPLAFNAITNTGATASTVASYDANKALTGVANASGALTNNGSGTVGYYNNFVPDARTVTIAGTANQVTSSAGAQDLTANRTWTLSVPSVFTAPGTIAAVTAMTNQSLTTPGVLTNDDKGKLLSTPTLPNALLANSQITIQGSAVSLGGSTLAAGATPFFGGDNITNLSYIMKTNNGGGNALVAGSPGTALTCILTNITADTTLAAMTFWTAGLSVIPVYASCSGGANKQLKFPANFQGAGDLYGIDLNGTGVTITNAEASWFEVRCIYGVKTNVFRSNTK